MRAAGPLLAAALALAAPSLAQAQAQARPRPAAATPLQTQLAARLLEFIDYRNQVRQGVETSTLPPELLAVRPDWAPMFKTAMTEELDRDMPVIEAMLGRTLGSTFSEEEMKVGLQIVADANLRTIYLAASSGAPDPKVQPAKATEDLLETPAGQAFAAKLQTIQSVLDPVQIEVMATVMPGVLRRFGEKADAAEVQRRAASGLPAK